MAAPIHQAFALGAAWVLTGCTQEAARPASAPSSVQTAPAPQDPAALEQENDGSGSSSPLPEARHGRETEEPAHARRAEGWSQLNVVCGAEVRRSTASLAE